MIDDIGAEEVTPWVRDEVIGPLLHYRMVQELPTFFSSNLNFEELEHHLSITREGAEETKAARIIEKLNLYQRHIIWMVKFKKQLKFKITIV